MLGSASSVRLFCMMITFVFVSEFWNFKTGVALAAGASHLGCVLDLTPDSEVDMMLMDLRAAGN